MNRRVFLAINLPENIRRKLADYISKWPEIPAKWVKDFNLHITLVFLGYVKDDGLIDIIKKAEKVCKSHSSFEIKLNKIVYGPLRPAGRDSEPSARKMIWAIGDKNEKLSKLKNDLESELFLSVNQNMEKYMPKEEKKAFSPHITLARIKQFQMNKMEEGEIPEINEKIAFNFDVNSVEVMESELKKSGLSYITLESIQLK